MAFSSSKTSPMLAAVQGQLWVQCRSLSLTLFGFYSKMDITPYFLASQKIRPVGVRKNGMVDNDPIICVTCHHYAVLSQSWGGNNQGGPGINFHPNPSSSHLLVLSIVEIKLASLRYSFICLWFYSFHMLGNWNKIQFISNRSFFGSSHNCLQTHKTHFHAQSSSIKNSSTLVTKC